MPRTAAQVCHLRATCRTLQESHATHTSMSSSGAQADELMQPTWMHLQLRLKDCNKPSQCPMCMAKVNVLSQHKRPSLAQIACIYACAQHEVTQEVRKQPAEHESQASTAATMQSTSMPVEESGEQPCDKASERCADNNTDKTQQAVGKSGDRKRKTMHPSAPKTPKTPTAKCKTQHQPKHPATQTMHRFRVSPASSSKPAVPDLDHARVPDAKGQHQPMLSVNQHEPKPDLIRVS